MTIVKDPKYRYYNCNIQCPYLLCKDIEIQNGSYFDPSGVSIVNGLSSNGQELMEHILYVEDVPSWKKTEWCGALTLYCTSAKGRANVIQCLVTGVNNLFNKAILYQNVGNLGGTQTLGIRSGSKSITFQTGEACRLSWVYQGL